MMNIGTFAIKLTFPIVGKRTLPPEIELEDGVVGEHDELINNMSNLSAALSDFSDWIINGRPSDSLLMLIYKMMQAGDTASRLQNIALQDMQESLGDVLSEIAKLMLESMDETGVSTDSEPQVEEEVEVPDEFQSFMDSLGGNDG